jgi:hypothetical protein
LLLQRDETNRSPFDAHKRENRRTHGDGSSK